MAIFFGWISRCMIQPHFDSPSVSKTQKEVWPLKRLFKLAMHAYKDLRTFGSNT